MAAVARRHQALTAEITQLDASLEALLEHAAPAGFLTKKGVGPVVAAAGHRRRQPRPAADRGELRRPLRRQPGRRLLRQAAPPPAQPRRGPARQPPPPARRPPP